MTRRTCAIYTRKSTEEGLEQDFNSLDAQRAACEAFIKSQAGEGWRAVKRRYDDGGFSGATLERPALQVLLEDMKAGRISIVVVYKVDRLTRSLTDFAKLVELFDKYGVSFVSVTQQFNTTSSMGRLTLNVLLSFAQFEREVTAERIRDKIAASKKKGLWMGGVVPLGYDVKDRKLIVNETEANTVRTLFGLYLQHGTVNQVKEKADRLGLATKARKPNNGRREGSVPFTRGHLYKLLENPIYAGYISHKGERYEGEHRAIIDLGDWEKVQSRLNENSVGRHHDKNLSTRSLLTGKLIDEAGEPLVPSYAKKGDRRYRYYISISLKAKRSDKDKGWRLPAIPIEEAVIRAICALLKDERQLIDQLELVGSSTAGLKELLSQANVLWEKFTDDEHPDRQTLLREILGQVRVREKRIVIELRKSKLCDLLKIQPYTGDRILKLTVPVEFKRRGVETKLILAPGLAARPKPQPALIKAISEAHSWFADLRSGRIASIRELTRYHGINQADMSRRLSLAFLAPDIVEAILEGRQPMELTAKALKRMRAPLTWAKQRQRLGFTD